MYDTNYNGKNVKRHTYVLPNGYAPTIKYSSAVPTYFDINNTAIPSGTEYINRNTINHNAVHHIKPSGLSRNGPNYLGGSVYSETAYTNNINSSIKALATPHSFNNGTSDSVVCGKGLNCLSNFPCLKKTTKPTESVITNRSHDGNIQRYVVKTNGTCPHREATICNGKTHPVIRSCENLYNNISTKGVQNYEPAPTPTPTPTPTLGTTPSSGVYKTKNNTNNNSNNSNNSNNYIIRPASLDKIPNMLHPKEQEIQYVYPTYSINNPTGGDMQRVKRDKVGNDISQRNYVHKSSPYDNASNYNTMLQMHDKQINDLKENINQNMTLNNLDNNIENQQLKEKLLDQKKKYAETLKHIEKLEGEKRTLKKNLIVRDKVLNKLENDMGSIDYENDLLRKIKDKTDLKEIHNVFKYLHGDKKDLIKKKIPKTTRTKYHQDDEPFSNSFTGGEDDDDNETDDQSSNGIVSINTIKKDRVKIKGKKDFSYKNDVFALKSAIVELEKEVRDLKEENKNVHFKYENTFKTLSELRKDALEYMESIVSRDTRIAYMETSLQKCEKDLSKMKEHSTKQKNIYESKIEKCLSEIKVLEKQSTHLQEMIQEKDTQIVLLKSDIVRNETLIKQYEDRNKELQSELRIMCNNLECVIEASNKKDIYMNELEKELRENEVHRQNAYLKEVAKNRKAQTDIKFKEMLYEKSAKNKINEMHKLKQELYINNIHMQKAKEAYNVLKKAPKLECLLPSAGSIDYDVNADVVETYQNEKKKNIKEADIPDAKEKVTHSEAKKGNAVNESKTQKK